MQAMSEHRDKHTAATRTRRAAKAHDKLFGKVRVRIGCGSLGGVRWGSVVSLTRLGE